MDPVDEYMSNPCSSTFTRAIEWLHKSNMEPEHVVEYLRWMKYSDVRTFLNLALEYMSKYEEEYGPKASSPLLEILLGSKSIILSEGM